MTVFWTAGMTVLTALGAILLAAAGVAHAARPREHRAVLRAHRLLPAASAAPVAVAVTAAEVLVGATVLAVLLAAPGAAVLPSTAQAALYCAFAGYAAVLRTRRPGLPCGCFGTAEVSWAVVSRAVVLAAGSAGCAVLGAPEPVPDRWACVAAGVVLAMANHLVPVWRGANYRKSGRSA
ncbi:MauE/DoxX family redox-associated membrane protein [Amycolatopsis sp. A133]|uniref:MauE/DoxX family redox-associated membrane protein n=1 Tax=Amycolatopsis sp. A133 TaxID=3064472 RepID=UPI0027EB1016|nr:MauE/DoxX family redox-associated membrane protein [Amycolatopsis sp. A133]MDQ7803100.1 MauE/DoxX family redox-associated membrane protein [Amycolatopsis sp. A133]